MKIKFKHPKKQERVLIAKDVIKWCRLGEIEAASTYGSADADANATHEINDARVLLSLVRGCHVCAKGAIVYGMIRRHDLVTVDDGFGVMDLVNEMASGSERDPYVTQLFGAEMLNEMESAFDFSNEWYRAFDDDNERLDAIMRNVIAHGGAFKIDDIPKPRKRANAHV